MTPVARRVHAGLTLLAVALTAFVAGVAVGGSGDAPQPAAAPERGAVLDEAADRIASDAARAVDRKVLERAAVDGMLRALGDRWSVYYQPSEFASFSDALDGRYTGVGMWLRQELDGSLTVSGVQDRSPAANAGIRVGDRVVTVDGVDVATASVSAVVANLRGPDGSTVAIGIRDAAGVRTASVTRTLVTATDVVVDRLRHQVLHIRVSAFTRGVGRQVRTALSADPAAASGGVVLDLRGNPGGLVDEAVEVAGAFLDGGPVVSYERRGRGVTTLESHADGDASTPLVVLVDGGTASAAEIVAGALQDRSRAVVIGSRTFGKGSVQEPQTLSDGSAIELTVGRYLTPSGRALDGVGVEPDVAVASGESPAVAERRALEVLSGLLAAMGSGGAG